MVIKSIPCFPWDSCVIVLCIVLSDEVPLVVSRQVLLVFAQDIFKMPAEIYKPVATQWVWHPLISPCRGDDPPHLSPGTPPHRALERLQPRVVSFEEPVTLIRESLAAQWVREEAWSKAAGVLAGIDLDSGLDQ